MPVTAAALRSAWQTPALGDRRRLDALLAAERRDRNLARLREELARRGAEAPAHPAAGPTRHAGARPLPSRKPRPTIHDARIGGASQAVRDGQAKRDARG